MPGATIDAALLGWIHDAIGADVDGFVRFPSADFRNAEFENADFTGVEFSGDVKFDGAKFVGDANFSKAKFFGDATFRGVHFADETGNAVFRDAKFLGSANLTEVQFCGDATFSGVHFSNKANNAIFRGAKFSGKADLPGVCFSGNADFRHVQFEDEASTVNFRDARFSHKADFSGAQFSYNADFSGANFEKDATFRETVFGGHGKIGPVEIAGELNLDESDFRESIRLDVTALRLSCKRACFAGRADLNVGRAEIVLDNATFLQGSLLTSAGESADVEQRPRARLLSLRRANVENFALSNIDLSACLFVGAHGLDQLRIEPDCDFAQTPRQRRYTQRRTLAEENHWRKWPPPPACLEPAAAVLDPLSIASLYRALRKAIEDRKDQPGAADFYYGEMEMRRHTSSGSRAEHVILALYWMFAGYGLRASRSLTAYVVIIGLVAVALARWGFGHPVSYGRAVLFALQSSVSLLHAPETKLSITGEAMDVIIRIAGPLLFGLALISLRGRVKR